MTSYFSERTAEYALVPALRAYLHTRYRSVCPIYYWKTREGNSHSAGLHHERQVKLLAMFARRPKSFVGASIVLGKINAEVAAFAHAANAVGIPAIAAFPAVQSIFGLYEQPRIYWLDLNGPMNVNVDSHFTVDLSHSNPAPIGLDGNPVLPLSFQQIANLIDEKAHTYIWRDAMALISKLRMDQPRISYHFPFLWLGGYKPIYFLVSDNV